MSSNKVRPAQQNTFFGNIADSLKEPLFTAQLKHATAGSYQFGEVDKTQFTGELTMQKVDTSSGWWQFESQKVRIGNQETIHMNKGATPAIADTGTSLLLMDDFVLKKYYEFVPGVQLGDQGYTFPCDTELPDLHLGLGPDYMATIPGELINYQRIGQNTCYGGLQSSQGQPIQILGDLLFKAQFTVFDMRGPSIGFAPHA
jgi:aspergillopepsin I